MLQAQRFVSHVPPSAFMADLFWTAIHIHCLGSWISLNGRFSLPLRR
jgi:hypothetical protein